MLESVIAGDIYFTAFLVIINTFHTNYLAPKKKRYLVLYILKGVDWEVARSGTKGCVQRWVGVETRGDSKERGENLFSEKKSLDDSFTGIVK